MAYERQIKESIQVIARNNKELFFRAKVISVQDNTCTVEYQGTILSEVLLTAAEGDDMVITPKTGSYVLILDLSHGEKRDLVVIKYDKIEKIVINQGSLGGIVIGDKIVDWMNKVASDMQTLANLLSVTPVTGNGAPLGITFNPQIGSVTTQDIENKNITHG